MLVGDVAPSGFREAWREGRKQPGFPSRREGLYLLSTLVVASAGIAASLVWPMPQPHLWQKAITTGLSAAFSVLLGFFLLAHGSKRPWLLPILAFALHIIGAYAIPFR